MLRELYVKRIIRSTSVH